MTKQWPWANKEWKKNPLHMNCTHIFLSSSIAITSRISIDIADDPKDTYSFFHSNLVQIFWMNIALMSAVGFRSFFFVRATSWFNIRSRKRSANWNFYQCHSNISNLFIWFSLGSCQSEAQKKNRREKRNLPTAPLLRKITVNWQIWNG